MVGQYKVGLLQGKLLNITNGKGIKIIQQHHFPVFFPALTHTHAHTHAHTHTHTHTQTDIVHVSLQDS